MNQGTSSRAFVPWLVLAVAALLALTLLAACGDDAADTAQGTTATSAATAPPSLEGELTVFAASSLTDAFNNLGKQFSAAHPGTKVSFSFASSSALAVQVNEGAPADVFASADEANMKIAADKGSVGAAAIFVQNAPVVVVPMGSTKVQSFADVAKPGVRLVLAGKDVPIGKYARQVLANASAANGGISIDFGNKALANVLSEEANVRAVLSKVQLGEADAGVVYKTDVAAAGGDVKQIEIPQQYNVVADYFIAPVKASKHRELAAAFIAYLQSDSAQAVLEKYGFGAPR
jgi:molybdate transport system substrate-binding protein